MDERPEGIDRELVTRAAAAFRELPGVHSVGIGGRERAGVSTGDIVLKVFVSHKRARTALGSRELIPAAFEGVPTDVVEAPSPKNAALEPGAPLGGPYADDSGRERPLLGGVQLAGENCFGRGTLGFIVRADEPFPMRIFAMTTHHALFSSVQAETADMRVGQPTGDDSVTNCCRGIFGKFAKGYRDAAMDAALVRLEAKAEYYAEIKGIGVIDGDHAVTAAEAAPLGYRVRKRGRTTGLTGGTIQALGVVHVTGSPRNYMVIKPNPATAGGTATFADYGDSGAGLVNDNGEIVGMLFALGEATPVNQTGWGFAWAIQDIKTRFAADGIDLIVEQTTVPEEKRIVRVRPDDVDEREHHATGEPARIARAVEADLAESDLGRRLTTFWMRHSVEMNRLVNQNRRVSVRWHRAHGPALFQCAVRAAASPDGPMPAIIDGRPADDCVADVLDLFDQHGSLILREDLRLLRALVPPVAGRSYREIVAGFQTTPPEAPPWQP